MTYPIDTLDFRQKAAWLLLPAEKQAWLEQLPDGLFERGLMVLDQENRGYDGRETWTRGVDAAARFVDNPNVFVEWIRAGDLVALDALLAVILDVRAGRRDDLRKTNPGLWAGLERCEATFSRLLLDQVDYPGLIVTLRAQANNAGGETQQA